MAPNWKQPKCPPLSVRVGRPGSPTAGTCPTLNRTVAMPAVTQMNGKHVTPRIWAQEAWSDVTYDVVEEARLQLRNVDWGFQVRGGGWDVAGRGRRWE